MKKKLLFLLFAISAFSIANAQCDPDAHDWAGAPFGVSPDPNLGETFVDGVLGEYYADIVYVKAPTNAGDVDPTLKSSGIIIDSISLDSITIFNGISDVQLSTIGLNVTCNNNNESPNPCMFFAGNPYCGDIQGIPTVAGTFDVKIYITAYFNFFGTQALPYSFDNFTLHIVDPALEVDESAELIASMAQNSPNPVASITTITFDLSQAEEARFQVSNLLGEKVYDRKLQGKRGVNNFRYDASELEPGIYLYSIQARDKRFTKRMIVQR